MPIPGTARLHPGQSEEDAVAYAHSANADGIRQDLVAHLRAVADLAAGFARALGAPEAARALGLWHDLGKFAPAFQRYLMESEAGIARRHGPDHKAAGTLLAARHLGPLALLIRGHHGGLVSPAELKAWLAEQASEPHPQAALRLARHAIPDLEPATPPPLPTGVECDPLNADLFLRLLFSALVDADYLDTERHFSPAAAGVRAAGLSLEELERRLTRDQARLSGQGSDPVSCARHEVYESCLAAAQQRPGLFRLTVPTGGGKTRSAMAFALRHALLHGQERVFVAIPYISITEQTADVYRKIFDADRDRPMAVLEHHSAAFSADGGDDCSPAAQWQRLAAENWDVPIVVTTTVQLFESLFTNTPGRARKLHRLANSVILIDEAQSLPPRLLEPVLDVLSRLARHYNTSVVFSTATQPAFEAIHAFRDLDAIEIVPSPDRLFSALKRVEYEWRLDPPLGWPEVARLIAGERQALAVVNTKRDALALLEALGDPDALHLSTLLCGAHRRRVLAEVRRRLAVGESCRLVSTQVVEAGVDLDFPVVLRALGPLDSLIQAAGRCNREGRLDRGRVVIFDTAEGRTPPGVYRTGTDVTRGLVGRGELDLHGTAAAHAYFTRLYQTVGPDREDIQGRRRALDFPAVARSFRMIEDDTEAVIVRYGSADEQRRLQGLVDAVQRRASAPRPLLRALQPYIVNVRRREAERLRRQGLIAPLAPGIGEWLGRYDPVCGLVGEDPDPDTLVV